eukprot:gene22122-28227_t
MFGALTLRVLEGTEKNSRIPNACDTCHTCYIINPKRRCQGMKKTVEGTSVADALKKAQEVSQSAAQLPSLPVVPEVVDSWDSVSTQPFCTVCQMAFKSMAFLERHTKYSDLHTKNAAKQGGAAMVSVAPKMEVVAPIAEDSSVSVSASGHSTSLAAKFLSKQVEGTDYKLLYTGSKFFWRNQRTVILDLYLHMVSLTIEVIAFDSDKHKEMNRLYLAADVISDLMDVAIVEEFEAKLKELHSNDRFAEVDEDKLKEELKLTRSISYIISRIQLGFGAGKSNTAIIVEFTKMSGDNYELRSPILEEPPLVLMPVGITRRRRTNAQEIEAKISSLSLDYKSISKDVDRAKNLSKDGLGLVHKAGSAERISNHVYNAVSYFAKKKWWTAAEVTPLRRKWVRAIRRVVLQRLVAITKTHLILKNIPFVSGAAAEAVGGQSPTRRGTRLSIRVRATEV